jgi:hypothetical protein
VSHGGVSFLALVGLLRKIPTAGYAALFLFSPEHDFRQYLSSRCGDSVGKVMHLLVQNDRERFQTASCRLMRGTRRHKVLSLRMET